MTNLGQALDGDRTPRAGVAGLIADAETIFTSGDAAEARRRLLEVLPLAVGDPELEVQAQTDLAVIAARVGSLGEATAYASEVLAKAPGHAPALEVMEFCVNLKEQEALAASRAVQADRIEHFRKLSTCARVRGEPTLEHPVLAIGRGEITFGRAVHFGCHQSPGYYDRYAYIEACYHDTHVEIGDNTFFNNGVTLRAYGAGISIGADCLFGWSVEVYDSDFHELDPTLRRSGSAPCRHVQIGNNVFVGAHVLVLKGVTIGDDTVVGAGSVVSQSLPAGVIAAGNPARVIKALGE